jgi:putative ABC transport system substrate-binding protein
VTSKTVLVVLGWLLAQLPLAGAQTPTKLYRLAFLASGGAVASSGLVDAFRQGMEERGWVEGKNISVDYRFAEGRVDRLATLANGLVRQPVDLIVAPSSAAAVAARHATSTIPIVMATVSDPVGLGLVDSLARPGGNVTGTAYSFDLEIYGKQLQLLKETLPTLRRVAILSNPASPSQNMLVRNIATSAHAMDLSLLLLEARAPDEFDRAFASMARERAEALLVASDPLFGTYAEQLGALAMRHRLPTIHGARSNVEAGGMMLYGPNIPATVRQATDYVDRILKGARPGELPIQQPVRFDLVINLKTARSLGITVPPSLLLRADRVIE